MKIKLIFDAQFVGRIECTVETKDNLSDDQIKSLFIKELDVSFDDNCYYEIIS